MNNPIERDACALCGDVLPFPELSPYGTYGRGPVVLHLCSTCKVVVRARVLAAGRASLAAQHAS